MCESKPNLNEFLEEVSLIRSRISNVLSILGKEDLEYILARLRTISTKSEDFLSNFSKYREKLEEIKQKLNSLGIQKVPALRGLAGDEMLGSISQEVIEVLNDIESHVKKLIENKD
ncbi:MAG: hypothetical protein ACTSVW_05435 [Candidatus Njordarchaeales archaeon]